MLKHLKKTSWLSVLMLLLLVACHDNGNVTPDASSHFVAGRLASVMVAQDYEVSFWEVSPGYLTLFQDRTVDADMAASVELKEILKMSDFVAMYKKLAGNAADPEAIRKIEAAQKRQANPLFKDFIGQSKGITLTSSLPDDAGSESARAQAACKEEKNGAKYFVDNFVKNNPKEFVHWVSRPPFTEFIGPMPSHQAFNIIILNGQEHGNGNDIVAEIPGLFSLTIRPWHIITSSAYVGPNQGGWFTVSFVNGLQCATNHIVLELIPPR